MRRWRHNPEAVLCLKGLPTEQWIDLVASEHKMRTYGRITSQGVESENGRLVEARPSPTFPVCS